MNEEEGKGCIPCLTRRFRHVSRPTKVVAPTYEEGVARRGEEGHTVAPQGGRDTCQNRRGGQYVTRNDEEW